jgi:hypothetical protein
MASGGVYTGRKKGTTKRKPERGGELCGTGMTLPEIAQALGINPRTISRYLKRESA